MKPDPALIAALRRLCAHGTDDDVAEFIVVAHRASHRQGFKLARQFPAMSVEDLDRDFDELALRSSEGSH
jgi:hypothetical protein